MFFREGERVFRTYFINVRGDEAMGTTWSYLDITPLGRQEDSPKGYPQTPPYKWWNWHDNYDAEACSKAAEWSPFINSLSPLPRLTGSGSRCPTPEKPPSESATQSSLTSGTVAEQKHDASCPPQTNSKASSAPTWPHWRVQRSTDRPASGETQPSSPVPCSRLDRDRQRSTAP
jgi:Bacterial protein of unknown function (DUF899)